MDEKHPRVQRLALQPLEREVSGKNRLDVDFNSWLYVASLNRAFYYRLSTL